jgi:ATP-binding protein involved in chromosome partitioning
MSPDHEVGALCFSEPQQLACIMIPIPYAITRRDDGLLIEWDERGHAGFFSARSLRLSCPCAGCVEEMSGRPLLDPATIPPDIKPLALQLVGAYGLRVNWSDAHSTGIYTFEQLLRDCPCSACGGTAE